MSVLILKNTPPEGPGTIEDFLKEQAIPYSVIDLKEERIPDARAFDILVMMGGPMSVNEEERYPYITEELKLTRQFIAAGKGVFGVCLGAQIMARALGASVYVGPQKEIGWYDIELTEDGVEDLVMRKLAEHPGTGDVWKRFKVFQWHGETFDIPEGALRLVGSELYPNQSFRFGTRAYAVQFHIEVRREMVYEWLKDEAVDMSPIREQTELFFDDYLGRAWNFYRAFFKEEAVGSLGS